MKVINKEVYAQVTIDNTNGEYSQLQAIKEISFKNGAEFAEETLLPKFYDMLTWTSKNNYHPIHNGSWCKGFMSYTHSSEDLFNIWLNENKI